MINMEHLSSVFIPVLLVSIQFFFSSSCVCVCVKAAYVSDCLQCRENNPRLEAHRAPLLSLLCSVSDVLQTLLRFGFHLMLNSFKGLTSAALKSSKLLCLRGAIINKDKEGDSYSQTGSSE